MTDEPNHNDQEEPTETPSLETAVLATHGRVSALIEVLLSNGTIDEREFWKSLQRQGASLDQALAEHRERDRASPPGILFVHDQDYKLRRTDSVQEWSQFMASIPPMVAEETVGPYTILTQFTGMSNAPGEGPFMTTLWYRMGDNTRVEVPWCRCRHWQPGDAMQDVIDRIFLAPYRKVSLWSRLRKALSPAAHRTKSPKKERNHE